MTEGGRRGFSLGRQLSRWGLGYRLAQSHLRPRPCGGKGTPEVKAETKKMVEMVDNIHNGGPSKETSLNWVFLFFKS